VELLTQLSGVRRSAAGGASNSSGAAAGASSAAAQGSTPSQLQQLQIQLQLERQQVREHLRHQVRYWTMESTSKSGWPFEGFSHKEIGALVLLREFFSFRGHP